MITLQPAVIVFLQELEKNNNRDWFAQHKEQYLSALNNFQQIVESLISLISVFDSSVANQEANRCIYRIYRDLRFSPDKRPYKIHFGAYICPSGKSTNNAGYYLHIQDNNSFLAAGLWSPEPLVLKKIRQEIYYNPQELSQILNQKEFLKTWGTLSQEGMLKRPPKGYPVDFEYINLLQYKNFCTSLCLSNTEIVASDFVKNSAKRFEIAYPFIHYMNYLLKLED